MWYTATMTNKGTMLISGGSGYLGSWVTHLAQQLWDTQATYYHHRPPTPRGSFHQLDLRDAQAVMALVQQLQPQILVHTAAANPGPQADYTGVNVHGTRNLARAGASVGAKFLHISSDVIFDGQRGNYSEADPANPCTPYGHSKAQAEAEVKDSGVEALIIRTSLIYGWQPALARQIRWILDDLQANKPVCLYSDQLRCPIWVQSLAAAIVELAGLDYSGVLHVAGAQTLSRYDFGVRLLKDLGLDPEVLVSLNGAEIGQGRPLNCTLDISRAQTVLNTPLPGVDAVLRQRAQSASA